MTIRTSGQGHVVRIAIVGLLAWRSMAAAFAADHAVPPLVPLPAHIAMQAGRHAVDADTLVQARGAGAEDVARTFSQLLARTLELSLAPATASTPEAGGIAFVIEAATAGTSPEAYRLIIDADRVEVRATAAHGLFNGAMTLWQLLATAPREGTGIVLPALRIDDAPRFAWRGYMLDSARHFHAVDDIKRLLDAMAQHKLNVFHWHLTDDQGWRIEIRAHPRLAEVGGCREAVGDIDPATGAERRHCGWYTQAQIREIVAYAGERHITVVPEIDLPGHATAAIAAYPALGLEGRAIPVSNQRGIHANLFNVEEDTFAFLDEVFAEVVELFPSPYIHVGGDEALKDQWQASPRVQARMRTLGIADEAALQSWFIHRLERMLAAHGRRLVGWDEILEGGLAPNAIVMSWRGIEGGIAAARLGHDVVMTPVSAMYLDYLQTASPNEPAGRPKLNTLETFYRFEPVPAELDAAQRRHVIGLQANMWTGDTRRIAGVEHNSFPRLAAVAETGWTPAARRDYADFLQRLPAQLQRYRLLGIAYARTPFEVMLDAVPVGADASDPARRARVSLSNPLGYAVHYTLDGFAPTTASPRYRDPLELTLPATLRAAAFSGGAALADARTFRVDADRLRTRTDEQLAVCDAAGPVLRMEDDGPPDVPGALFNVAILAPCWQWMQAPMAATSGVRVRVGRLPYLFQLGAEDAQRRTLPARTAHGELDIRIDGCDGPRIASAPLPASPAADGFAVVEAAWSSPVEGARDLCIRFSGDTRPAMWVLDTLTLLPAATE